MRSGSDRCRSATRPGASPKPSRTARPDFCSPSRQPNRFSAASAAPSRLSRQRTASTRCARARWRDPSAGTFLRPATARFIGKLCRHKRARSLRRFRHHYRLLVKNDTRERIELADPGRAIEHGLGVGITAIPALHDAGWTEVDVLGVVLAIELRRQQPHDMHPRRTAVRGEFLRGLSSNTASVGVFDRMPPSQYNSPSMRTAGNAGGSAPDAIICLTPNLQSRLSKYLIRLERTWAAPTVSRGVQRLTRSKSTSSPRVRSCGSVE